jgi:hypothetical protein
MWEQIAERLKDELRATVPDPVVRAGLLETVRELCKALLWQLNADVGEAINDYFAHGEVNK